MGDSSLPKNNNKLLVNLPSWVLASSETSAEEVQNVFKSTTCT